MILVRYFVFVFFSILSFTTTNLSGQQVINDSLLKKMKFYSDSLRNSYNQQTRFSANDSFIELLKEFLSDDNSYNVEPDSINTVAFVRSPDNKFRFISWLLADNQGNYKSYGIIQHKDKKGEVYNTWLREKIISDIKELENTEYGVEEWPGGLIYKIIPFKFKNKTRYLLLSFHGLGRETNRKTIDVLSVEKNEFTFGLPVFERYKKDIDPNFRVVFTYSDQTTMTLRLDDASKEKIIVFDHLVAPSDMLRGDSQFLVPDGTYGCFVLQKKGKWLRIEDFGTYKRWED
jgi:hypothetical protein